MYVKYAWFASRGSAGSVEETEKENIFENVKHSFERGASVKILPY